MLQMTRKAAEKIVSRELGGKITGIKPLSKGNINKMYEISVKGTASKLILRLYNEAWKVDKEVYLYKLIKESIGLPVPEVKFYDDTLSRFPFGYAILSKLPGAQLDKAYKKSHNKALFRAAGEALAKLHSIKFKSFGWIVGKEIRPSFRKWGDFVEHDIEHKLENIMAIGGIKTIAPHVRRFMEDNKALLRVRSGPSLLHKDYHPAHILTDSISVTGILDMEWAIAGHSENDFIKMELWAFSGMPEARQEFFDGYIKFGDISEEYSERRRVYELWHNVNMVSISHQIGNMKWLRTNMRQLERFLHEHN